VTVRVLTDIDMRYGASIIPDGRCIGGRRLIERGCATRGNILNEVRRRRTRWLSGQLTHPRYAAHGRPMGIVFLFKSGDIIGHPSFPFLPLVWINQSASESQYTVVLVRSRLAVGMCM